MATFYFGDCLIQMKKLPSQSINLIYWNPPYGTTQNTWDESLNWEDLFKECFRLLRSDGMLVIHCSIPFNYELIRRCPRPPSYSWYWKKDAPTCPLIANHQPLRIVEEILVWKNKKNTYYRQNEGTEERKSSYGTTKSYYGDISRGAKASKIIGKTRTHFLDMPRNKSARGGPKRDQDFVTRTDEMIELFIKHYTKEGDVVLDPTCYKGLTGVICKRLNRKWIGIDKYFMPSLLIGKST